MSIKGVGSTDGELRDTCLDLCFHACYRLRLNMEVTAVAMTFLQRYAQRSDDPVHIFGPYIAENDAKLVVATCIFLAAKVEETPRRLRDVINVTHRLTWQREASASPPPSSSGGTSPGPPTSTSSGNAAARDDGGGLLNLDHEYVRVKERVVETEQKVLRALNFDLECPTPFRALLHAAKFLRWPCRKTVQAAWSLVVDALWLPELACADAMETGQATAGSTMLESDNSSSESTTASSSSQGSVAVASPMATAAAALYLASELTDAGRASNPLAACLPKLPLTSSEPSSTTVPLPYGASSRSSSSSSSSSSNGSCTSRGSSRESSEYRGSNGGSSASRHGDAMGSSSVSAAVHGSLREQVGQGRAAAAAGLPWWQALGTSDADLAYMCTLLLKAAAQAEARRAQLQQLLAIAETSSGESQVPLPEPVSSEQRRALEGLLAQLENLADDPPLSQATTISDRKRAAQNVSMESNRATAGESGAFAADNEALRPKRPRTVDESLSDADYGSHGLQDSRALVAAAASATREALNGDD